MLQDSILVISHIFLKELLLIRDVAIDFQIDLDHCVIKWEMIEIDCKNCSKFRSQNSIISYLITRWSRSIWKSIATSLIATYTDTNGKRFIRPGSLHQFRLEFFNPAALNENLIIMYLFKKNIYAHPVRYYISVCLIRRVKRNYLI